MGFQASDADIHTLFNRTRYNIPRNQRKYVWDQRNWKELFEDISIVAENPKQPPHFIGSIVLKDEGREQGISRYTIIDGQQRIMTLTIFLVSIMYMLKLEHMEDDFNGTQQYVMAKNDKNNEIMIVNAEQYASFENILNNIITSDEAILRQKNVRTFFDALNLNRNRDKHIVDAFVSYVGYIKEKLNAPNNTKLYLLKLRDALISTKYVSIIASSDEDSYTIFEILNARGIDLEDHELLKNYIMRFVQPEEDRDKAKDYWNGIETKLGKHLSKFIKHYAVHKYGYIANLSPYKTIQQGTKGKNTSELLKDIMQKSDYYYKIVNPMITGEDPNCSKTEYKIFEFFKKRRQEQLRPILLSLLHCVHNGLLSTTKYEKILLILYNFFICYNLIGKQNSNRLTDIINKYARKLEEGYSDTVLAEFIQSLKNKLPPRENFINLFKDIGWSHHSGYYDGDDNKNRVKIVLETFEYFLSGYCDNDFTIEHVLPDSENRINGQIGNLIPLENRLNDRCADKQLSEKVLTYKESNFKSSRKLAERIISQDNYFDIENRTNHLAKTFYDDILNFQRLLEEI